MQIRYTSLNCWGEEIGTETEGITHILYDAFTGYSEEKVQTLIEFMQLMIVDFLDRHPEKIGDILSIIDFDGKNPEIIK